MINQTDILLIRHGETDWNKECKMQGFSDVPLNANGMAQAEMLAHKLLKSYPNIAQTIYSSNLKRAVETAKKTVDVFKAGGIGINDIVTKNDLREICWGVLEGVTIPENNKQRYNDYTEKLRIAYPSREHRWNHPIIPEKGVECLNSLVERATKAIEEICRAHPGEKVAIFAHGKLINTLIIHSLNQNSDQLQPLPNCAVVHFRFNHENTQQPLKFLKIENLLE